MVESAEGQTIPPPFINYQAVLYDVNNPTPNAVFANQSFQTFVNINDELGNLLYREEHYASTDGNGLITVKMGDALYVAGPITNFNQIDWGTGKYYLVVDFNINGTISSTAPEQLVTVPYSFYSGKAGNGMTSVSDNGNGTLTFTYANGSTYTTPTLSGIQGPAGATGHVGPAGPSGAVGQSAYELWLAQGNTGTVQDFLSSSAYQIWLAQGNTGTAQDFLNTLVGPAGASGQAGPQGVAGIQGPIGPTGPQGVQGPIGLTGAMGPQGPTGATGLDGKSAYEIAVLNGFVGTETQWLMSLVGATGAAGPQGPIGLTGPMGPQGIQGPIGLTGATGPAGTYIAGNGITINNNEISVNTLALPQSLQGVRIGFASSSLWTCPPGVTQITVELWGAGGGGGGSSYLTTSCYKYVGNSSSNTTYVGNSGGSGGSGGYKKQVISVTPGTSYSIIVGNGGIGGVTGTPSSPAGINGGNGENSSFNGLVIANGGSGGQGAPMTCGCPNPVYPVGAYGTTTCTGIPSASNGTSASVQNYNWPGNPANVPGYIPSSYLSLFPTCCAGGGGGGGATSWSCCSSTLGGTSGGSGTNGFCVISY